MLRRPVTLSVVEGCLLFHGSTPLTMTFRHPELPALSLSKGSRRVGATHHDGKIEGWNKH